MPPKKKTTPKAAKKEAPKQEEQSTSTAPEQNQEEDADEKVELSKKRKLNFKTETEPEKPTRKSARGAPKSHPSSEQTIRYLLSPEALELCRPDEESKALEEADTKNMRTYSVTPLSPFEELLCAAILSRPISHALGHRTIRTILNPPYNFTNPKAIQDAGRERVLEAIFDARTQHKEKTATEISRLADVLIEKFIKEGDATDTSLDAVRQEAEEDVDQERELLQENIKGIAKTGLDIFFRRVQWMWEESYPFVDSRSQNALKELGLPTEAEQLSELVERHWEELGSAAVDGDVDVEGKKRRAFVVVLERIVGAHLEGKIDRVKEEAANVASR
ncbi:hypothetical protein K402DRAFT_412616 [Aulographum hederae CBS 113979]|uniref:Uncharacterized protein n=1 Tax=Aulographum hederae CBS 113979 TaxID=1176131 RepID=A0A6G1H0S4_9PEZI|nr:hypothetical protein K402DRAFT_412616 [Aulographum hederae CBS 113979]